ncbi:3-phosphoshikimate 1-carboxyvinyltransferase [Bradyrhizobium sp. USDA 336]|uniref:3-phosphoshikimate 1-carboxyvinyltransferase n=1 Tax=Bradyrhizobium sp. USDA 336 TaxID=3156311 RepID=UPI0038334786
MISYPDLEVGGTVSNRESSWERSSSYLPSDKSISHRLLLFAALSDKPVEIEDLNTGAAVWLLLEALIHLGIQVEHDKEARKTILRGRLQDLPKVGIPTVQLGPSSAAARLLIGALVGVGMNCIVDGDETLRRRPFDWIVDPLIQMGGQLDYLGERGALPIRVFKGDFRGGEVQTRVGSAQAVSALLFAAIAARRRVVIEYPALARNHTQVMAAAFGEAVDDADNRVSYTPRQLRMPERTKVPKDPSAIAYVAALFWLTNRNNPGAALEIKDVCLNRTRLGFFDWMAKCGFGLEVKEIREVCGEPIGSLSLRGGGTLLAVGLDDKEAFHAMIDEIPLACAICCTIPGEARFRNLFELTFKETDRIAATREMLLHLGLTIEVDHYDIQVCGGQIVKPRPFVPSFDDHRLSMTAHVMLLAYRVSARVISGACYRTSFPDFGKCLAALMAAE